MRVRTLFINTPLQRGEGSMVESRNCFNGFAWTVETVETVSGRCEVADTPLKQGVNERRIRTYPD